MAALNITNEVARIIAEQDARCREARARFAELVAAEIQAGRFRVSSSFMRMSRYVYNRNHVELVLDVNLSPAELTYLRAKTPMEFGISAASVHLPPGSISVLLCPANERFAALAVAQLNAELQALVAACEAKALRGECTPFRSRECNAFSARRGLSFVFTTDELERIAPGRGDAFVALQLACFEGSADSVSVFAKQDDAEAVEVQLLCWEAGGGASLAEGAAAPGDLFR
jgi:hypothetical protein